MDDTVLKIELNETFYIMSNDTFVFELEEFYHFRIILSWLDLVIIIIGLILNTVSAHVFSSKANFSSTNILIASLSVSANLVLVCMLINHVFYAIVISRSYFHLVQAVMFILPYSHPIFMTFFVSFIYLTMSISLNQFFYVRFSKGYKNFRKNTFRKEVRRSCVIMFSIYAFSILFCSPFWFRLNYTDQKGVEKTSFAKSYFFNQIYQYWIFLPLVGLIPHSVLITTNMYLITTLNKTVQRKTALSSKRIETSRLGLNFETQSIDFSKRSDLLKAFRLSQNIPLERLLSLIGLDQTRLERANKTSKLIIAVGFFLVCQTPNLIIQIMESLNNDELIQINENYLIEIARFMLILNLSFNFSFVYLVNFKKN